MLQGFWYEQGDAAALVGADSKVNSGGGAWVLRVTRRKTRRKGRKWKDPSGLFITGQKISDKRENQGVQSGKRHSCHLDFRDAINDGNILIFLCRDDIMMIRCYVQRMTS